MKYIIIKGSKSSGKSATVKDICKRLNPSSIKQLYIDETGMATLRPLAVTEIGSDNYLLTIKKRTILVVAAAPTEQRKRITDILFAVQSLNIYPELGIIAMCGIEKLKDYATAKELEKFGECIHETRIWRIPSNQFHKTDEWDSRISQLTSLTLRNI
jgi:Cdc6-like AAA superfamily ATPase